MLCKPPEEKPQTEPSREGQVDTGSRLVLPEGPAREPRQRLDGPGGKHLGFASIRMAIEATGLDAVEVETQTSVSNSSFCSLVE